MEIETEVELLREGFKWTVAAMRHVQPFVGHESGWAKDLSSMESILAQLLADAEEAKVCEAKPDSADHKHDAVNCPALETINRLASVASTACQNLNTELIGILNAAEKRGEHSRGGVAPPRAAPPTHSLDAEEMAREIADFVLAEIAEAKGQQAEADAEIIETLNVNHAAALKSARREALVSACQEVCPACAQKDIAHFDLSGKYPCGHIRRLIAAMDSDAGKVGT